jgi:hypothetical protein
VRQKVHGRDPLLVWYTERERIMERDDLARAIDNWRRDARRDRRGNQSRAA